MPGILTLNIWNNEGQWEKRLPLIREWIQLLDPDLVGFQEVLSGSMFDQANVLFAGTDYHLDYASNMKYWNDSGLDIGNLIASRWPIVDREVTVLPQLDKTGGQVLLSVDIDSPFGIISFHTTHLRARPHRGHIREQQVQIIGETVFRRRSRDGFPPILCGDFNAVPESSEIRYLKGLHTLNGQSICLYDAWEVAGNGTPGYTFSKENTYLKNRSTSARLDYIFVGEASANGQGCIENCYRVCDLPRSGEFPSDHFGVFVELSE